MAKAAGTADIGSLGQGIALVLLANFLFSFTDVSTKLLLGAGLVVGQLAFMRYAVQFAITAGERLITRRRLSAMTPRVFTLVVFRSFCLVSSTVANFFALGHLSLAVTSALLYLSPIFICLFARVLLGEAITRHHWIAIALGLVGALVIVDPFGEDVNWYAVLMLYPATGMALYQVLTRKLAGQATPGTLQFATGALGTVVLAPVALSVWVPPTTPLDWALLCGLGLFAWAGHEALTRAYAHAPAGTLAPFGYSFVLYLILAGIVVFGDSPGRATLFGAALIIAGGLYAWARTR